MRYKLAYVKAILRQDSPPPWHGRARPAASSQTPACEQDIGWYDTNNPLQLSTRIGERRIRGRAGAVNGVSSRRSAVNRRGPQDD